MRWNGVLDNGPLKCAQQKSKSQLLEQAKKIYPAPQNKIKKIAENIHENDLTLKMMFLAVAHPELNPIEMVLECIKRAVAAKNLSFKLRYVEHDAKNEIAKINAQQFVKFTNHTLKEESKHRAFSTEISD